MKYSLFFKHILSFSSQIYPVPDVALPSSPTSSVSSSSGGVPPEYFHMDHLLESLDDDRTSESS